MVQRCDEAHLDSWEDDHKELAVSEIRAARMDR